MPPELPQRRAGRKNAGKKFRAPQRDPERSRAGRELKSFRTFMLGFQGIIWIAAFILGSSAGFVFADWFLGDESIPALSLFLILACSILFVLGALNLKKNPLAWSLAFAIPLTLYFGQPLLFRSEIGEFPLLIILMAWGGVMAGLQVRTFLQEHPELRLDPSPRSTQKMLLTGTLILTLFLLLGAGVRWGGSKMENVEARAPSSSAQEPKVPLDPLLRQFERAWKAKDLQALGALYPKRLASRGRRLGARLEKHGFEDFPALDRGPALEHKGLFQRRAVYETEAGKIQLVYRFVDGKWEMVALRM